MDASVQVILLHGNDVACNINKGFFTDNNTCGPPGDRCVSAFLIPSVPTVINGSTAAFADDLNSVCPYTPTGARDVVYKYTPPGDQVLSLTLCADASYPSPTTSYDTKLYVFADNCTGTAIGCNDDACSAPLYTGGPYVSTIVGLAVTGGTTYYIVVDGYSSGEFGNYTLRIDAVSAPANDDCGDAETLTVLDSEDDCGGTSGTLVLGTQDGGELSCIPGFPGPFTDVWYTFEATSTSTGYTWTQTLATLGLEVFEGSCGGASVFCAAGISAPTGSFLTTPGQTYVMRLLSLQGDEGTFDICVYQAAPPVNPCDNIATISACDVPTGPVATNPGIGSWSTGLGGPYQTPGEERVFSYTASTTGVHIIEVLQIDGGFVDFFWKAAGTCDISGWNYWDDVIATGPMPGDAFNGGVAPNFTSGNTYYILWDSEDLDGNTVDFQIQCAVAPPPPANDLCDDAIAISCNSVTSGTTVNSSAIGAPPTCVTTLNGPGVWYTVQGWDGEMRAYTCSPNTDYDTKIGVFTGTCGAFTCVVGNDDDATCTQGPTPPAQGLRSRVTWAATSGTTYYIYVTGFGGGTGIFDLTVECGDNNAACLENGVSMVLDTDANADVQTTWEIRAQGTNVLAVSGTGLLPGADDYTMHGCLPDGCYYLRALDSGGDGLAGGGYILREQSGQQRRIIDNRNNWSSGTESAIAANEGFCLPISNDRLVFTSCDKLDWKSSPCGYEYIVATDNPLVTAQWNVSNATSGYQMWWFNPNGGYSFKRIQYHNTANGLAASSIRACHFKLNSWSGNQLQPLTMYNVKVRSILTGDFGVWGSACRMMIDNAASQCPKTKLHDIPGESVFSCGATRAIATNVLVHARPVRRMLPNCSWQNANRYQFRFRVTGQPGLTVAKLSNTNQYFVNTSGLICGTTYEVDVRASFDNGMNWCSPNGAAPWGEVCQLFTVACAAQGGNQNMVEEGTAAGMRMFPNPNRGDQLFLSVEAIEAGVSTVSVDIFDAFGKRAITRTIPVTDDGFINTVLELNGSLATGLYMVNITAGETVYTERLVIQP
ncbi:MAG: T9SS type A sorting domain-containing protein [Flavobacteriales bacterium]|nr:T9SS type A sorting domain-containing protein [Flavobacteriales bacterium]